MAHSLASRKRWRQSLKRRDRNRSVKSRTRTLINRAVATIGQEQEASEEAVRAAVSSLDRAAQKGVIHPNAAARGKSRLLKRFNLATASAVAATAEEVPAPTRRRATKKTAAKADAESKPAAKRPPRSRAAKAEEGEAAPAEEEKKPRSRSRKTT